MEPRTARDIVRPMTPEPPATTSVPSSLVARKRELVRQRIVEAADELFAHPREDYTRELIDAVPGASIPLYGEGAGPER